jgi:DNA processing protein
VKHLGSAEMVFQASLTELEVTGTQAVSAESIATGKSAELAGEEISRAAGGGVTIVTGEDFCYPPRLKEIYDPRWVLSVRGKPAVLRQPGNARTDDYQPGVDTASHRGAIAAKRKASRYLAPALT